MNYKQIYLNQVLPKKKVTKNTLATYIDLLKVYNNFSVFKERANKEVL